MTSSWIKGDPMTGIFTRPRGRFGHREIQRQTPRGEGQVNTEAETGVTQPQAKDPRPRPRAAFQDPSLEPSEGVQPCRHLNFRLLASRMVRE